MKKRFCPKLISVLLLISCNAFAASTHKSRCLDLLLGKERVATLHEDVYWDAIEALANMEAPQFARLDPEIVAELLAEMLRNQKQVESFLEAIRIQGENKIIVELIDRSRIPHAARGQIAYIRLTRGNQTVTFELGPYYPAVTTYTGPVN